MELKYRDYKIILFFVHLLIVPYGIEILHKQMEHAYRDTLLIVPYGIEILLFVRTPVSCDCLLIVPYGIEIVLLQLQT